LIISVLAFGAVAGGITGLLNTPMWPMAEMTYSGVFVVFQVIDFFYFIVNMFKHFNVFLLFGVIGSGFLTVVWLFNAYQWYRARTPTATTTTGNQATAAAPPHFAPNFPAGVNPA
ncbi:MARVEL domain-containing protein, partial [Trichostrongylus colubriformis]